MHESEAFKVLLVGKFGFYQREGQKEGCLGHACGAAIAAYKTCQEATKPIDFSNLGTQLIYAGSIYYLNALYNDRERSHRLSNAMVNICHRR